MNKDLNILVDQINSLLKEKKFEELIKKINDNFDKNDISPAILNILGAAKIFKTNASKKDKVSGAEDLRQAFVKDNSFINALINYIRISIELENYQNALDLAKKYELKNGYQKDICKGIARINFKIGNVKESVKYLEKVLKRNEGSITNWTQYLTRLNYDNFVSQEEYLKKCREFSSQLPVFDEKKLSKLISKKNKKIKLGFLSADFRTHPVSSLVLNVIEYLNKNKFEIFGFSNTPKEKYDNKTTKYKNIFNHWDDISVLDDFESINLIRKKELDILIHLGGLFDRNRLSIIKNRVAQKQISWININTTGVENMDYLIADENLIKKNEEIYYSEKIIYMPNIWNVHNGFENNKVTQKFNETKPNVTFVFGSFNNFDKISEKAVLVWSNILKKVKKSKLILRSSNKLNNEYILSKFEKYDVNKQIEIYDTIEDHNIHLQSYQKIDLALDTFPTPGIATTFEALWMGTPVLTMKGFNLCSRAGESIMKNIHMEELISENENEYIKKAVEFSNDITKLNSIKNKIYDETKKSKLYDSLLFKKELENKLLDLL